MPPLQHTLLVVGGSGFLGSSISRHALANAWRVISISPSGKPYLSPAGHRPAWSSSPNIEWHAADALRPHSYAHLAARATAVVHTLGILLEADYKPNPSRSLSDIASNALAGIAKGWGYAPNSAANPLAADAASRHQPTPSYQVMNRDSAISVAHTFLSALQQRDPSSQPAPFVYISAEDIFRPIIDARYITTKRQAERAIAKLALYSSSRSAPPLPDADGAGLPPHEIDSNADAVDADFDANADAVAGPGAATPLLRPVFMRPGLMYHPHTRPLSTLPAAILEASAAFHRSPPLPLPLPTPAAVLSSSLAPAALRPMARLLTTPPLHIDTVAKAVCRAIADATVAGPIDPTHIQHLAGWHTSLSSSPSSSSSPASPLPPRAPATTAAVSSSPWSTQRRPLSTLRPSAATAMATRRTFFTLPDLSKLVPSSPGPTDDQGHTVFETSQTLPYTADHLYSVVSDVDSYRYFLPYCQESRVLSTTTPSPVPVGVEGADVEHLAELAIGFASFQERYTSRVSCKRNQWVHAESQYPNPVFRHLSSTWTFQPLPSDPSRGGESGGQTNVTFRLAYAFRNPLYASVASSVFESMSSQVMHAFQRRVEHLYPQRNGGHWRS